MPKTPEKLILTSKVIAESAICMVATSKVTTRDAKNARKMDVSPGR